MKPRPHPPALAHGDLRELFPGVFFVTGTIAMPGPLPVRFSRNMTVLREDDGLVIVNSVRLDEGGLAALDRLGKVKHVVRIAGFHGADDAFYQERYGARVWALDGHKYVAGFDQRGEEYFRADVAVGAATELPIAGAKLHLFSTRPAEGILFLAREGGIAIPGDALQNWDKKDDYFSFLGGVMMKVMGFIKPHNVGPAWLKQAKPPASELRGVLDHDFDHVLPAHGAEVIGGAKAAFRPAIERAAASRG
jgi:hypothetical protein